MFSRIFSVKNKINRVKNIRNRKNEDPEMFQLIVMIIVVILIGFGIYYFMKNYIMTSDTTKEYGIVYPYKGDGKNFIKCPRGCYRSSCLIKDNKEIPKDGCKFDFQCEYCKDDFTQNFYASDLRKRFIIPAVTATQEDDMKKSDYGLLNDDINKYNEDIKEINQQIEKENERNRIIDELRL